MHGSEQPLKRIQPLNDSSKGLHDFVTQSARRFFEILGLSQEFLVYDPSDWSSQDTYRSNQSIALSVKVFNDLAKKDGQGLRQHLRTIFWAHDDYKASVVNAPVLLAYYTCRNLPQGVWNGAASVRELRRHRKFDRQWFELAYDYGVKMCIAAELVGDGGVGQLAKGSR